VPVIDWHTHLTKEKILMQDLKQLKDDYVIQLAEYEQAKLNSNQKQTELQEIKQQLAEIRVTVNGLDLKVKSAKNGLNISPLEFTALKKELADKSASLHELVELMPFYENEQREATNKVPYYNGFITDTSSKIANIIVEQAINEVLDTHTDTLKTLAHAILSQYKVPRRGKVEDIYKLLGEKLCTQIFAVDGTPSVENAAKTLDNFIKQAA